MPKHTKRSVLIDSLLVLLNHKKLTFNDLLSPKTQKQLSEPARQYLAKFHGKALDPELRTAMRYMKYNQLIFESKDQFLSVTDKAKKRLVRSDFEHIIVPRPKKWDKKWRLVMFEIPESHKTKRDALTIKLKQLGFKPLQDSVLAHPFPCQNQIQQVCDFYGLTKFVVFIESSKTSNNQNLQKQFASLLK